MVTYNAEKYLDKALTPFVNKKEDWDIFVVDNCSIDNTVSIIESKFPFVNLTKSKENLGFGGANNIGLKYALENEYEHVLLLNQDAYITQECIRNLIKSQKNNPEYYVLSPMQFDSTEKSLDIDFGCFMLENKELTIDALSGIYKKEIYDCRFTPAACWLISLECIKNIGGFNPTFYHYGEDDNYSHRVLFQGKKYGVLPQEKVIHDRLYRPANTKFDEKFKIKYRKWLANLSNPNNNFVYELYKIAQTTLFHFYSINYLKMFFKLLQNLTFINKNKNKSKVLGRNWV